MGASGPDNNGGENRYFLAASGLGGLGVAARAFRASAAAAITELREEVHEAFNTAFNLNDRTGQTMRENFTMAVSSGQLSATQVSIALAGSAAALDVAAQEKREEKEKQAASDRLYQMLLDRMRETSDRLARQIREMESEFESRYGDAWREQIANQVLDPDLIPQQQEGESLADYRKRLEQALFDEMLNPDGTVKDQYKSGPNARYAEWARKEHEKKENDKDMKDLTDPSLTQEQRQERAQNIADKNDWNQIVLAKQALSQNNGGLGVIEEARDELRDSATNANSNISDAGFLMS